VSPLLHRIRLQHVRCLLATAQHGNMRAAAEALSITQPAVTKTIKELEDIVGQPLVQRLRHGVALTPAGELFARHAREGVQALEQALGSVVRPEGGVLRLGVLPSLAVDWLQALLMAWREREPQGAVHIVTGRNAELLAQLQRGELDAVLGRLAEPDRMLALRFEPLWAEPLVVAMRPGHPMASVPLSAWQRLAHLVILPLAGTAIRQGADGFLGLRGCELAQGQIETLSVPLARALVKDAEALWFTPESTVRADVAKGLLQALTLPGVASEAVGLFLKASGTGQLDGRLEALSALVHALAKQERQT
jgi:LysR family pca operon transcriptional activator